MAFATLRRFERLLADLRCATSVKEEAQLAPEPSQTRDPKKDSLFVVPLAAFALQRCVDSDGRGRTATHLTVVFPVVFFRSKSAPIPRGNIPSRSTAT